MAPAPRMTLRTLAVLRVMLDDPLAQYYGLEVARDVGLPTGSVYPILARLERAGWLRSAWEDVEPAAVGRRKRRYYQLTTSGALSARRAMSEAQRSIQLTLQRVAGFQGLSEAAT
jgi:PadR family transcriptional regulator PadR